MKLKYLLLLALCFSFLACNSESTDDSNTDDEQEETNDSTLLKSIVYNYEVEEGESETLNFSYEDNKLISIKSTDGSETKITYTDDKITRIENLDDDEIMEFFTISYDDENQFSGYVQYLYDIDGEDIAYNNILTYNDNNTIDIERYKGDFSSQTESRGVTTYTIIDSNITKIEFDDITDYYSYEYDSEKGFFANVLEFEVFNFINYRSEYGFYLFGGENNLLKLEDIQEGWSTSLDRYEYEYNEDGYPISAKNYYDDDIDDDIAETLESSIEYIYE